VRTPMLTAGP